MITFLTNAVGDNSSDFTKAEMLPVASFQPNIGGV